METFGNKPLGKNVDFLGQTEAEWLGTGKFKVEKVKIDSNDNEIRCALAESNESRENHKLLIMTGGIPRDPEKRSKLPLINKLYGNLAIKMLEGKSSKQQSSLLYNQPATGGSDGEWEKETLRTRTDALSQLTTYFKNTGNYSDVSLLGTSAAAYIAVNAIKEIQESGIKITKLILLSPACYPKDIEDVPYGENFSKVIRQKWDITQSPIFKGIENYAKSGGSVYVSFFEVDDPPIPLYIQDYYRKFLQSLAGSGFDVRVNTIPGVSHNFHRIGALPGDRDIVNNSSVRNTSNILKEFLVEDSK